MSTPEERLRLAYEASIRGEVASALANTAWRQWARRLLAGEDKAQLPPEVLNWTDDELRAKVEELIGRKG